MYATRAIAAAILLVFASCKKEATVAPSAPSPAYVCCPSLPPTPITPASGDAIAAPTTFRWSKVDGSAYYGIQAECSWTHLGQSNTLYLVSATSADTSYTLTSIPSNVPNGSAGRWRVAAVGTSATGAVAGPYSAWTDFTVQR